MVPSCGSTSSTEPVRHELLAARRPRAATTPSWWIPGFEPDRVHALLDAAREAAGRGPAHARPRRPRGRGGRLRGRRRCPCSSTRPTPSRSRTRRCGTRASTNPLVRGEGPPDDRRRRRAGRSPASRSRCVHTPGHTPGHCCFRTDAFVFSGDLVFAGLDRALRLPELVARPTWSEPAPVPDAARRAARCCPATARTRRSGASARRTRSSRGSR